MKYFKNVLLKLQMKIYIDTKNYQNGKYLDIIHQIPTKKRKSYILIQNLIKNIKNDDRILNNDMIIKFYISIIFI